MMPKQSFYIYSLKKIFPILVFTLSIFATNTLLAHAVNYNWGTAPTIHWTVSGASTCTGTTNYPPSAGDGINGNWTVTDSGLGAGVHNAAGSITFNPIAAAPGTYTFVCTNGASGAMGSDTLVVSCPSGKTWDGSTCSSTVPPTVTLNAFTPPSITVGNTSSISFTSTNATSCTGTGIFGGSIGTSSPGATTPVQNTPGTFPQQATCTGPGGSASSVTQNLTVSCPSGTSWLGGACRCADGLYWNTGSSSCSACSNGGCSGTGGSPGTPYGSLTCNNGSSSVPVCTPPPCANGAIDAGTCKQCGSGLYWNTGTSACAACSNGGCSGPGGSQTDPLDALTCNNGGSPVPTCTPPPCANGATNPSACNVCPVSSGLYWNGTGCVPCGATGCSGCSASSASAFNGCTCNNGSATIPSCTSGVINGACNPTHYVCNEGNPVSTVDGGSSWTWTCQGSGTGHTDAFCSEAKPAGGACDTDHYSCVTGSSGAHYSSGSGYYSWSCTAAGGTDWCSEGAPPASAWLDGSTCSISSGSSCSGRASWTTSGIVGSVSVRNNLVEFSTDPAQIFGIPVTLNHGDNTLTIIDTASPSRILGTKILSVTCDSGAKLVWDGSSCVPAVLTATPNPCYIPMGNSTCSLTVYSFAGSEYSAFTQNADSGETRAVGTTTFTMDPTFGSAQTILLTQNIPSSGYFTLKSINIPILCEVGSSWSAGKCVTDATKPDLTVTGLTPSSSITAGSPASFTASVRNIGKDITAAKISGGGPTFDNFLQVATGPGGTGTITDSPTIKQINVVDDGTMTSGETRNLVFSYTFPTTGPFSVRVCADKSDRSDTGLVTEEDEGNNCSSPWTDITMVCPLNFDCSGGVPVPAVPTLTLDGSDPTYVSQTWNCVNPAAVSATMARSPAPGAGLIGTTGNNVPDVTGITASTTYTYTLSCFDAAGGAGRMIGQTIANVTTATALSISVVTTCTNGTTNPPTCNSCGAGTFFDGVSCVSSSICSRTTVDNFCYTATAKNGIVEAGEECDGGPDGTGSAGLSDASVQKCSSVGTITCKNGSHDAPGCGAAPGRVPHGSGSSEVAMCTNGAMQSSAPACHTCPTGQNYVGGNCITAICGNAVKEGAEECDVNDGVTSGKVCNAQCKLATIGAPSGPTSACQLPEYTTTCGGTKRLDILNSASTTMYTQNPYVSAYAFDPSAPDTYVFTCAYNSRSISQSRTASCAVMGSTNKFNIIVSPKTIQANTSVTVSWIAQNPNALCRIIARPVITKPTTKCNFSCILDREREAQRLTSILATTNTDSSDSFGSRSMNTALTSETSLGSGKAQGRKSVELKYSNLLIGSCAINPILDGNASRAKIQVAGDIEG